MIEQITITDKIPKRTEKEQKEYQKKVNNWYKRIKRDGIMECEYKSCKCNCDEVEKACDTVESILKVMKMPDNIKIVRALLKREGHVSEEFLIELTGLNNSTIREGLNSLELVHIVKYSYHFKRLYYLTDLAKEVLGIEIEGSE